MTTWRLTVHRRAFSHWDSPPSVAYAKDTGLGELTDARSRRLELKANTPARCTFTLDGRSPSALELEELTTEVMAWRDGVLMFRGVLTQSEDVVTAQAHSVNFTALDYLAVLNRRYLLTPADWVLTDDQDELVRQLLDWAVRVQTTALPHVDLRPGSSLPLYVRSVDPDGSDREALSGTVRDRTWAPHSAIGQLMTDLGACQGGFDIDVWPRADTDGTDYLRVFFPQQGVARPDVTLHYGSTVSGFTRSVTSTDYGNFQRLVGAPAGGQGRPIWSEAWNDDANDVTRTPVGLWELAGQDSDVSVQATLDEHTAGALERSGVLVPSYSLTLRPDWYTPGAPAMGDTVPLVLKTGRLEVDTTVRVLGITYAIGDDGQEDVDLTVGRSATNLTGLFRTMARDVSALARR